MTVLALVALVMLCIAGVPIFLSIFISVIIMLVMGMDISPIVATSVMFNRMSSVSLLAVPIFLLLGYILAMGGAAKPLVKLLNAFLGHLPGGPAYCVIIGNVLIAAMCSSPLAGIAAFGPMMIPLLTDLGYSRSFAVGLVIVSAVLEPLIPPSTTTILYSFISAGFGKEPVSVTTLWTASVFPGLLIAALLAVTVYFHSRRGHFKKLPRASWSERLLSLKEGWAILIMPAVVLGPLYIGWATPTEVSALGLVYVCVISIFVYRGLNLKVFWQACCGTMRILSTIFVILMSALLFSVAVTYARVPYHMSNWLTDLGLAWYFLMAAIIVLYILMGMFLDPGSIILISIPILLPVALAAGIHPIVYGIFACIATNLANVTPPYGLTIFASQTVLGESYLSVCKSVMMFLPAVIIGMVTVAYWPGLTTWLPAVTGR